MSLNKPSKRLFLINRDFQFRYVRAGITTGIISTVLTGVVILYPLYLFKILVVPRFLPTPILAGMLLAVCINIGMIVLFGVLISHKIAGPMFSMVRHLRKIANGQWRTQMHIRQGDDLQFVVRNLNDMSQALVQTATSDLELVDRAIEQLSSEEKQAHESLRKLRESIYQRLSSTDLPTTPKEKGH